MARGELSKQQISAFADGELPDHEVGPVMAALRAPGHRADWDIYHQIGDTLRSETMATPVSAGFSDRFAARLATEPPLLAPRPHWRERITRNWPVVTAAMAAALTGFVIAPQFMHEDAAGNRAPKMIAEAVSHASVIARADIGPSSMAPSDPSVPAISDYIRIHHSSHPSLYGAAQWMQPADLNSQADH